MQQDDRGLALTTDSPDAAAALALAIGNFCRWRAAVMPALKAARETDPTFGFAHVAGGLILHAARDARFQPMIAEALTAAHAVQGGMSPRERLYLAALQAAASGRIAESVSVYETILAYHPTDLFAQRLAQMELFWIGEMRWSAEISGRITAHWNENTPDYGHHLSCRAFDLEEIHEFEEAERLARTAVDRDPTDVWGTHAVAHVLIMQGRHGEGIAWLDGLKHNWEDANQMKLHLWWHRCLFHLERGETEAVLDVYDAWVRNRSLDLLQAMPDLYIDMQNGASMLLRLQLRGVDVGARWEELCDLTLPRVDDHTSPFTSAHFAVILAACGRFQEADGLIRSMKAFATEPEKTLAPRYGVAAVPAAEAAVAHARGDHQAVIEALFPARHMLWQMGGSHAQRDLFFLILADSVRRLERRDLMPILVDDVAWAGFTEPAERIGYAGMAAERIV